MSNTISRRQLLGTGAVLAACPSSIMASESAREGRTKFAVNIEMWLNELPFLGRIAAVERLGFPAIEFWNWQSKDIPAMAAAVKKHGLAVTQFTAWGFSPGLNNPENHARFVEAIREACDVADQLDCTMFTVVAGNDQPGMTTREMHDHVIAGLKLAAPIAEERGKVMILEPMNGRVDHPGHCLYGSAPAIRICQEVDSPAVKINWDLYHMQITEGDLCGRMRDGFEHIAYLQLADHPGRHEPGTGEVHYNRVLEQAWKLGYRGYVGLECSPRDGAELAAERVRAADVW
ncbi:MAG: hydroxypyruvate isomerase [Chlamydiales bacterium]|jgi:hydroxypyruvate isomerase